MIYWRRLDLWMGNGSRHPYDDAHIVCRYMWRLTWCHVMLIRIPICMVVSKVVFLFQDERTQVLTSTGLVITVSIGGHKFLFWYCRGSDERKSHEALWGVVHPRKSDHTISGEVFGVDGVCVGGGGGARFARDLGLWRATTRRRSMIFAGIRHVFQGVFLIMLLGPSIITNTCKRVLVPLQFDQS